MSSVVPPRSVTPTIDIYIKLARYPILADKIRARMRQELFRRGVVDEGTFEGEVRQKAIESQRRERLTDPYGQEETQTWQRRKARVRDAQTDAYFARHIGLAALEGIIREVLQQQPRPSSSPQLTFNPEIAPWEVLFRQGELYERLPAEQHEAVQHHLEEIKVVLIKRMISDQLPYIAVAKRIFTIADLRAIYARRIGSGKIGGKAAGLMLAWRILMAGPDRHPAPPDGPVQNAAALSSPANSADIAIPDSYFIGTEVIYDFRLANGLEHWMNQKYRSLAEIREEYPKIVEAHLAGEMPAAIVERLREVLTAMGKAPLIVRSSSLLEDNFGYAFAGKYNSYFCPNQGTPDENLAELLDAIRRVYASTLNPDAILYRQKHGLIDYDERMAVLVQRAIGRRQEGYYFPTLAGVGFSQNPFRWHSQIRREDGFLRLVWGFGTRAVERVSNDYPRLIALSHPQLRPETTARAIRQYAQWYIDVIDLKDNSFRTLPVVDVLHRNYPYLRYIASIYRGDYMEDMVSSGSLRGDDEYVLTFNGLTKDRRFIELMRGALQRLERAYGRPVDMEFIVDIIPNQPHTEYRLHLLQCRPLSQRVDEGAIVIPRDIPPEAILFRARRLVPDGRAEDIRYIVYVDPERYHLVPNPTIKHELGRAIGRLNKRLEDEHFILMGPGRWGSVNIDLGVHVTYADIHNTKVLVEMAVARNGYAPELSYGTHFFQDLVEAGIHSLAVHVEESKGVAEAAGNRGAKWSESRGRDSDFNWRFFREAPNCLAELSPGDKDLAGYLKVIDLSALPGSPRLSVLMDGAREEGVGFLTF
ncbi:PEP/pyruvate-binding domain-containing protein [Promineifilum sp.]|uniref:PEP/pyruvate-binding domain-containing protein n=1 Tax=Promineifilum sp. TaxID=2664178 RepID=UPI0035B27EAE